MTNITIYFAKSAGNYKKKEFDSLEQLKEKLNVDYIQNEEEFIKNLKKYKDVYCFYQVEIPDYDESENDPKTLCWELTPEKADDSYYNQCESI